MTRASLLFPLALTFLALAVGCRSLPEELQKQEAKVATSLQAQAAAFRTRPERIVSWAEATAQLQAHNLALREARDAVLSSRERQRLVNRDLIPGAAITGNVTKAITQLGDLRGEDAALSIYGFFNVPGLIQWHVRRYAAELTLLRAESAHALKSRELTIQLRELFVRGSLLTQRHRQLALAQRWQTASPVARSLDASPQKLEHEALLWSLRQEDGLLQDAIAALLGDTSVIWRFDPADLPSFDYATTGVDPHDPARFGRLYRQLQAIELEGARLRQRGIRLQSWPDLTLNLTSAPLYQSRGGQTWSADSLILTLGATVPLDFRGSIAQQLRETKRDFSRLEAKLREQNALTLATLARARESLQLNSRRLRLTEARLDALRTLPAGLTPARARDNLERLIALDQQRTASLIEQTQLEAFFWFLDESRWTDVPVPTGPTPP